MLATASLALLSLLKEGVRLIQASRHRHNNDLVNRPLQLLMCFRYLWRGVVVPQAPPTLLVTIAVSRKRSRVLFDYQYWNGFHD